MSQFTSESIFAEAAGWNLWDVNVRVGPSGIHGELALEMPALLEEMKRYFIRAAIAMHGTAAEYDAAVGNEALSRISASELIPAWTPLPDRESIEQLARRRPRAVRLMPRNPNHNFPVTPWGAGELLEYLQAGKVVTLIAREDIEWEALVKVLESFPGLTLVLLDVGYRADRYLFPLLERFPNLYFDSATYLAHRQLEAFVDRFGPDRVLFGSRLPLFTPAASLAVLSSMRVSDAARLAVAGGNLRRLLAVAEQSAKA
jgi:amidohydrolase family protein